MNKTDEDTPDIEVEKTEHGWKLRVQLSPIEWLLVLISACIYVFAGLL